MLNRRALLLALGGLAGPARTQGLSRAGAPFYPEVTPRSLNFPADHGAHPAFRIEWWYLTGWLAEDGSGGRLTGTGSEETAKTLGFQITFFRVRTDINTENPSAFAAHQLVIAHAALADPARGRLLLDERIARAGFGLAGAAIGDTNLRLDDWWLRRDAGSDTYRARIVARDFQLVLEAVSPSSPWLQGDDGLSHKGPLPNQASYYYSRPQLAVSAELDVGADGASPRNRRLTGIGWLDHEWSSAALAPDAAGWDWTGMNLDDGSSLLAFQVRRQGSGPALARYAAIRSPTGHTRIADPATVCFTPREYWTSARSGATWPIAQRIQVGDRLFDTQPLMADQELDSRQTTGAVYWEGASTLLEAGRPAGRGYLEMTGYLKPMKL